MYTDEWSLHVHTGAPFSSIMSTDMRKIKEASDYLTTMSIDMRPGKTDFSDRHKTNLCGVSARKGSPPSGKGTLGNPELKFFEA